MDVVIRAIASGDPAVDAMIRLFGEAYPIMSLTSADAVNRAADRITAALDEPGTRYVVAERDGAVVGAMRLYDYTMNVRGRDALAGGVGSVAVALAHKRRGVARALIAWYLDHYRSRAAALAILHPFRPDFYRALGFGYGTPTYRYGFRPASLRDGGARGTVRTLREGDVDAMLACAARVHATQNGDIARRRETLVRALADPSVRYAGVDDGGELRAFLHTTVELGPKQTNNRNRLIARDVVAETPEHLAALLGYLRAQQDQFLDVTIESQDPALFLAADDPRDLSDRAVAPPAAHRFAETGLGMMYRVLDHDRAFAHLPAAAADFALRVETADAWYPPTALAATYRFGTAGAPQRDDAMLPDATLRIGIADLSSLVVGSLGLRDLVRHRLAAVEPADRTLAVARLFDAGDPPVSYARF